MTNAMDMLNTNDLVKTHLGLATKHVVQRAETDFQDGVGLYFSNIGLSGQPEPDSVAEMVFEIWMHAFEYPHDHVSLRRQVEVTGVDQKPYRFDFVVYFDPEGTGSWGEPTVCFQLPLAVEIDGHAFHEKTLDQVNYRNRRDRALQASGFRVLHFSYNELVANPLKCAEEVSQIAWSMSGDAFNQRYGERARKPE